MGFQSFEERAKKDPDYIRRRLEIHGGYDKHGDVFGIARQLPGPVLLPLKTFHDAKALEQFIDEFTFFRYGGRCPSWHSVLFASDCFSDEEKSSNTLKGKSYTPDRGKAYVTQLIASGELVVHCSGSWIPPGDRNHHLPWRPKSSRQEEFLPVVQQPYSLGPHEEPGYVRPEKTSTIADKEEPGYEPPNKISTMSGGEVVPDSQTIASASSGNLKELLPTSSLNKRQLAIHEALTKQGAVGQFNKKSVSMTDLKAITQVTGDEYNMFTLGSQRTIIRGYGNEVSVSLQMYDDLLQGNYGRWSGHTHPPGYSIKPGPADRPFLQQMGQQRSAIWGDNGHYTFGQLPLDDALIQSEIMRKQWQRIYGD